MKITHRPRARAQGHNDAFRSQLIRAVGVTAPPAASAAAPSSGSSTPRAPPSPSTHLDRAGRVRSRDGVALDATQLAQLLKPHGGIASRERAASSASLLAADIGDVAIEVAYAASESEGEDGFSLSTVSGDITSRASTSSANLTGISALLAASPTAVHVAPTSGAASTSAAVGSASVEDADAGSDDDGDTVSLSQTSPSPLHTTASVVSFPSPALLPLPAVSLMRAPSDASSEERSMRIGKSAAGLVRSNTSSPPWPVTARRGFPVWDLAYYEHARRRRMAARRMGPERVPTDVIDRGDPRWVNSATVAACQQCGVRFTLMLRRHHCRACGSCVCADCTPYHTRDMPRVCRSCNALRRGTVMRRTDISDVFGLMDAVAAGDVMEVEKRVAWLPALAADCSPDTGITPLHVAVCTRGGAAHRLFQEHVKALSAATVSGAVVAPLRVVLDAALRSAGVIDSAPGTPVAAPVDAIVRNSGGVPASPALDAAAVAKQRLGTPVQTARSPRPRPGTPLQVGMASPAFPARSPMLTSIGSLVTAASDVLNFSLPASATAAVESHSSESLSTRVRADDGDDDVWPRSAATSLAERVAVFVAHTSAHASSSASVPSASIDAAYEDERIAMSMTRTLLKAGSSVNATAHSGMTPLHAAAAFGTGPVVRILLNAGAMQARQDKNGFTAYDVVKLRQIYVRDGHASDILAQLESKYASSNFADVLMRLSERSAPLRPPYHAPAPVLNSATVGEWWRIGDASVAGRTEDAQEDGGDAAGVESEEAGEESELSSRAEALPLPPRTQMLEMGIQHLDPAAQALQANLLAVRNSYDRWLHEREWQISLGGTSNARYRYSQLGLLSAATAHELGWRRANALVSQVWKLGHPAAADGDVADMLEANYARINPKSPFVQLHEIRADAALRARSAPIAATSVANGSATVGGGGKGKKKRLNA